LDGDVYMILGNRICDVEMKGTESHPCPVEVLGIISFELSYSTTRVSSKSVLTLNAKNIAAAIYLPRREHVKQLMMRTDLNVK